MKARYLLLSLALIGLGGCVSSAYQPATSSASEAKESSRPDWLPPDGDREHVELSKDQVEEIKNRIKSRLRDPESAQFGDSIYGTRLANSSGDPDAFCGSVNAKNAYGGYVGNTNFAVYENDIFMPKEGVSWEGIAVLRLCK